MLVPITSVDKPSEKNDWSKRDYNKFKIHSPYTLFAVFTVNDKVMRQFSGG
jgi:hypothetical protein